MFKIYDGREHFWQWDLNQKLIVEDPEITEVHFCNRTDDCSLVVEVIDGLANVPNILLQEDWKIKVYAYSVDHTKHEACFKVATRSKPADYVYTETEVKDYNSLLDKINGKVDKSNVLTEINYDVSADEIYNARAINWITQQINEMFATKTYVNEQLGGIENGSY